jgi:hypothetical protein
MTHSACHAGIDPLVNHYRARYVVVGSSDSFGSQLVVLDEPVVTRGPA